MNVRALVFAIAVSCPLVALADTPKTPTAADKQKAAEHWDRARVAYSFGNYDDAIREYQAAFDLTGAPEYVFNIAQTQRAKGDKRGALASYKKYIELDPTGQGVASARSHIDGIELELAAEAAAEAKRQQERADAEAKRQKDAAAAAEAARLEAIEVAKRRVADNETARRKTTSRYFRIAGLSTAGAGLVTLGASTYFGLRARSLSRDASSATEMWTEEAQRDVDRAKSAERTMFVLLGVGGGLAITGTVLYVIGARSPERVVVTPTTGGAAVTFGGRF